MTVCASTCGSSAFKMYIEGAIITAIIIIIIMHIEFNSRDSRRNDKNSFFNTLSLTCNGMLL